MKTKNIGYHTRLINNNASKVCGGSFGGALDLETANRLVNTHFNVIVKTSGTPVFVDREGREVSLYMSVDPSLTIGSVRESCGYAWDPMAKASHCAGFRRLSDSRSSVRNQPR